MTAPHAEQAFADRHHDGRLDAQQVVDLLVAAQGRSVALATLADAGVAFPGAIICHLELVGATVERVYEHERVVGARFGG